MTAKRQHGREVAIKHVLVHNGGCIPVGAGSDGSLRDHPYNIGRCRLCEQDGSHPHAGNTRWRDLQRRQGRRIISSPIIVD